MNCPVCYEIFAETSPARVLSCKHILCTTCIESELIDNTFYCPECGEEHRGSHINEISQLYATEIISSTSDTDTDNDSYGEDRLSQKSRDSDTSFNTDSPSRPLSTRGPCKESGCSKKSLPHGDGFCLIHSKNLSSNITAVVEIANDMADTNLNFVSLSGSQLHTRNALMDSSPDELIEKFKAQERITFGEAMELIDQAKDIMFREPNILQLDAPVIVVGDIHGQFYDLVNLLDEGGKPGLDNVYLFLGDYVDRGCFSSEVMLTLLKLKVAYPDKIYLLRGNHECSSVSGHFGFKEECKIKYGVNVYYRFLLTFQTMPLAAVISTAYGDIFACHGGLSPLFKTLEDIQKINRFVEPEDDPALLDILWSDPVEEYEMDAMNDTEYEEFMRIEFRPNPTRGCSHKFGYKAVKDFLDRNNLVCIVRAHEVQEEGFKRHFDPSLMEKRMKQILGRKARAKKEKIDIELKRKGSLLEGNNSPSLRSNGDIDTGYSSNTSCDDKDLSIRNTLDSFDTENLESPDNLAFAAYTEDFPPVITVFSAPNYCDRYENKAAILRIDLALDEFRYVYMYTYILYTCMYIFIYIYICIYI
jgi:diadenosine tetraphosphatase ApaH/serine/threonine PP2A family protein phosphatase